MSSKGGGIITSADGYINENKDNIYLLPKMLDHYQIQLTHMLETEQYAEAKRLLSFLIQCQGEDSRNYEEWGNLLSWLEMADLGSEQDEESEDDADAESKMRAEALQPTEQNEAYEKQVLYIMRNHPMIDQQLLALERAVYLESPEVNAVIMDWIAEQPLHPILQFKSLQTLRRRGGRGIIELERLGDNVKFVIEDTPLSLKEFPNTVQRIVERTEQVLEAWDPMMLQFAREIWKESLQFLYGSAPYQWMVQDEDMVDCFAAALHLIVQLTVYGQANDDDNREVYGITEAKRFKYEQAVKALRQVAFLHQSAED